MPPQAGTQMINIVQGALKGIPIHYLADWTDRIAAGELPNTKSARIRSTGRKIARCSPMAHPSRGHKD